MLCRPDVFDENYCLVRSMLYGKLTTASLQSQTHNAYLLQRLDRNHRAQDHRFTCPQYLSWIVPSAYTKTTNCLLRCIHEALSEHEELDYGVDGLSFLQIPWINVRKHGNSIVLVSWVNIFEETRSISETGEFDGTAMGPIASTSSPVGDISSNIARYATPTVLTSASLTKVLPQRYECYFELPMQEVLVLGA